LGNRVCRAAEFAAAALTSPQWHVGLQWNGRLPTAPAQLLLQCTGGDSATAITDAVMPIGADPGGRLFVDLTAAVRSTLGRQVVPRIFDVMEARSAAMVRSLFDDPRLSVVYGPGRALRAIARIAVRCRIPLLLLRVVVTPGFVPRHLAALQAGLTAGLDLPGDPIPADHLRVAERILTERMPILPPSVIPILLVAMGSYVLTGKLQPDADPALREAVLRSMPHNVTTEMDLRLWALAGEIRHDPTAAAELTGTAPATLAARYRAGMLAAGTQRGRPDAAAGSVPG
jgi:pyruvate,water dikinase